MTAESTATSVAYAARLYAIFSAGMRWTTNTTADPMTRASTSSRDPHTARPTAIGMLANVIE